MLFRIPSQANAAARFDSVFVPGSEVCRNRRGLVNGFKVLP